MKPYSSVECVYLSGIPATGKTTIQRFMCDVGWRGISEFLDPIPSYVYSPAEGSLSECIKAQDWVISQNIRKNELIKATISREMPVIVDRGPLDVVAYSYMLGIKVFEHSIERMRDVNWIGGQLYLLNATTEIACERLMQRDSIAKNERDKWLNFLSILNNSYSEVVSRSNQSLKENIMNVDAVKDNPGIISNRILSDCASKHGQPFNFNLFISNL